MNAREFWTCTRVVWLSVRDCFVSALTFAAVQYWYVLHEKGFWFLPYPSLLSWELLLLIRQISNIFSNKACYSFLGRSFSRVSHQYLISPMQTWLRVVPLPLSPSCVSQKETVGKKKNGRQVFGRSFYSRGFLRVPRDGLGKRRTTRSIDERELWVAIDKVTMDICTAWSSCIAGTGSVATMWLQRSTS